MVEGIHQSPTNKYETYIESWNKDTMDALNKMNINSHTTINLAFASFNFSWNKEGKPVMGGMQMHSAHIQKVVNLVHREGGKVKLSFGGANPNYYLSDAMKPMNPKGLSIGAMSGAIVNVTKYYNFDGIDLDLENQCSSPSAAQTFAHAAGTLIDQIRGGFDHSNNPNRTIGLALKGQDWGENGFTKDLLTSQDPPVMKDVDTVSFMEYDLWIKSGNTYPQQVKSDIQYYMKNWNVPADKIMLGLMPGKNDESQNLTLQDAKELTKWAKTQHLAGIMSWDANKDYEGRDGNSSFAYTKAIDGLLFGGDEQMINALSQQNSKPKKPKLPPGGGMRM